MLLPHKLAPSPPIESLPHSQHTSTAPASLPPEFTWLPYRTLSDVPIDHQWSVIDLTGSPTGSRNLGSDLFDSDSDIVFLGNESAPKIAPLPSRHPSTDFGTSVENPPTKRRAPSTVKKARDGRDGVIRPPMFSDNAQENKSLAKILGKRVRDE